MTATTIPGAAPAAARVSVARGYRFELVKLLAQWRVRLLILACWIGPAIAVAVVSQQTSLPADTLFGRWMHATGWAGALVVLGFAGTWVLPLITSMVAGDVFSSEDRLGTWRHLLRGRAFAPADLRSRRRWRASASSSCSCPGWPSPA